MTSIVAKAQVPGAVAIDRAITEPLAPLNERIASRQCPPWCVQHAEKLADLRIPDASVTHYGRTYHLPVVFDGDVVTFDLSLFRFDEDPAAGKIGEPTVYTNFDGHGIDMTIEQARSMRRFLGSMLRVVDREDELVEFAGMLVDLGKSLRAQAPAAPSTKTDQAASPFPPCPDWCAGDCTGGEPETLGNGTVVINDRVHEKTLAAMSVVNGDSRGDRSIDLKLFVERWDSLDPQELPVETRALIWVNGGKTNLQPSSEQLRQLARAALEAADLLDAAKAAEGR